MAANGAAVSGRRSLEAMLPAVSEGHRRHVRAILSSHRIPPQDAEDIVQTALLALTASWDDVRDPGAWLCGTLRRCCLGYWRERRRFAQRFEELDGLALELGVESGRSRRDLLIDLDRALAKLPPSHRRLLVLRYRLGFKTDEAAQAVGLASGSVRQTVRRSLARLSTAVHETPQAPGT